MANSIPEFGVGLAGGERSELYRGYLQRVFPTERVRATGFPPVPSICFPHDPQQARFLAPDTSSLHLVEAPSVTNFRIGLLTVLNSFRMAYPGQLLQAVVVVRGQASARRLLETADGSYRASLPLGGLDPDFMNPHGFEQVLVELRTQTPWIHVLETDVASQASVIAGFLNGVMEGKVPLRRG